MTATHTTPLGKLAFIDRGISWAASQETREPKSDSVPVLRIGNIQQRLEMADLLYLDGVSEKQKRENTASRGAVLMVGSNGNHDRIGNCCRIEGDESYLFASFLIGLLPNTDEIDAGFLFHTLRSRKVQNAVTASVTGTTGLANLSLSFLKALEVFRPPAPAQKAIAIFLDTVDRAIDQTKALLAKQQRIKTGLMHDLLTRGIDAGGNLRRLAEHEFIPSPLGDIPASWATVRLSSLCPKDSPITYGVLKPGPFVPNGVPLLQIEDVIHGDIELSRLHRISTSLAAQYDRTRLKGGEIVVSLVGTIGKTAWIPLSLVGANIHRNLAKIEVAPPNIPEFFFYVLQASATQRAIRDTTLGSTQSLLNLDALRNLWIPIPSPEEQKLLVARIAAQSTTINATQDCLCKLRRLKSGLMHDLLTGTVPVTPLLSASSKVI